MAVIPTGWAQCSVKFTGANVPNGAAIVIGVQNVIAGSATGVGLEVFLAFATAVNDMCTADVTLTSVDVKLGPNDTGAIGTYSGTPTPGASGSTSLSPGSAVLVEKGSAFGGRRSRGRMFWPGVYDGWVDDTGGFVAGVQAQIDAFMLTLLSDLDTAGVPMAILHTPSYTWELVGGQPRRVYADPGTVPVPYLVDQLTTDPIIATQRRRLR